MPTTKNETSPNNSIHQSQQSAYWSGVFAMTLCVFSLIASEFMPVSLLTPLAEDLAVSEGLAGQGIAISGAFAVITSLLISRLAGAIDRKALLLLFTALMAVSGAIIALAQNYAIYMVGRAFIGVVVGGFWSLSAATAIRLVPAKDVPKALSIFNGGNALATIVAAPLGAYLGAVVGWRGAFACLVPIAIIVFIWQWRSLPSMPALANEGKPKGFFHLLRRKHIALGMAACGSFFMGQFILYTYIRPFLEIETEVSPSMLSLALVTIGIAGFIGTTLVNLFIRRSLFGTIITIPLLMAAVALSLTALGHWLPGVFLLLALWGLFSTAAPVGWWSWLAHAMPEDAEAGGGLMVAIIQLAIALGSTVGGLLFDWHGHISTFSASAAVLVLAAIIAWYTAQKTPA
ncbi:MFS transporter [Halioxenophilus aromaticivorans]|uniref:MFS transporter n=1 Tax=Halioxenophilus aromaticivorans TaxID=1306992 RepID=A0AAV3U7G1_9ALTE